MECPRCGSSHVVEGTCATCRHTLSTNEILVAASRPPAPEAAQEETPVVIGKPFNVAEFISFRQLITPDIIRIVYLLGVLALSISSIYYAFFNPRQTVSAAIAYGLGILIVGNVAWRVLCEFYIVIFSIHEALWRKSQ
jgi:hypothetical protein